MPEEYVLRDRDRDEIDRLGFQHRVWSGETEEAIALSGFQAGMQLLDLGGGPGFLARDLKRKFGADTRVGCADKSEVFLTHVREANREQPEAQVEPLSCDITHAIPDAPGSWDGVISRWVLMFLPDPQEIVRKVYRSLAPGGAFVSIEYFQFRHISIWPPSTIFDRIYNAVHELIRQYGGNPDIGSEMPSLMEDAGFQIETVLPVYKTGQSGSDIWQWLEMTGRNHRNLVEHGLIAPDDLEQYYRDWKERANDSNAFITAPPLMITVGRK